MKSFSLLLRAMGAMLLMVLFVVMSTSIFWIGVELIIQLVVTGNHIYTGLFAIYCTYLVVHHHEIDRMIENFSEKMFGWVSDLLNR